MNDVGKYVGDPFIPPGCDRPALYQQDGRYFDAHDREIVPGKAGNGAATPAANGHHGGEDSRPTAASRDAASDARVEALPFDEAVAVELAGHAAAASDKMPAAIFRGLGKLFLGVACPEKKADIAAALKVFAEARKVAPAGIPMRAGDAAAQLGDSVQPKAEAAPAPVQTKVLTYDDVAGGAPPKASPPKAERAAEAKAHAVAPAKPASAPTPPQPAKNGTGVDLPAWARGQKDYVFGEVRKAIDTKYGRSVMERREAVEFLVDEGVITAAEARKDVSL